VWHYAAIKTANRETLNSKTLIRSQTWNIHYTKLIPGRADAAQHNASSRSTAITSQAEWTS